METKAEVERGKNLMVREASHSEMEELHSILLDINVELRKLKELVEEYDELIEVRYYDNRAILDKVVPILTLHNDPNVEDVRIDMIQLTSRMVDIVRLLEHFIVDLEESLRRLKRLSRYWRSRLGLPKDLDQIYNVFGRIIELSSKLPNPPKEQQEQLEQQA